MVRSCPKLSILVIGKECRHMPLLLQPYSMRVWYEVKYKVWCGVRCEVRYESAGMLVCVFIGYADVVHRRGVEGVVEVCGCLLLNWIGIYIYIYSY